MVTADIHTGTSVLSTEVLQGVSLLTVPGAELVEIILEEGAFIEKHSMPMDVIFYVKKGTCTITVGEETQLIPSGTAVLSPAGVSKSIGHAEGITAEVLVMKVLQHTGGK